MMDGCKPPQSAHAHHHQSIRRVRLLWSRAAHEWEIFPKDVMPVAAWLLSPQEMKSLAGLVSQRARRRNGAS